MRDHSKEIKYTKRSTDRAGTAIKTHEARGLENKYEKLEIILHGQEPSSG